MNKENRTYDAVIRNFEIIGEAAKNIPVEIKDKYPEVPWEEMYLLRNKVSHEYFGIGIVENTLAEFLTDDRIDLVDRLGKGGNHDIS